MKRQDIILDINPGKAEIESLFHAGGTITSDELKNAVTTKNVLSSAKEDDTYKFIIEKIYLIIKNNHIHAIKHDKHVSKKIVKDFSFSYKIQKTQVRAIDLEKFIHKKENSFLPIFASKLFEK